jgi:hypothetical protein
MLRLKQNGEALLKRFHVSDQRFQLIGRKIDWGHTAGGHFGRGMCKEWSELLRRELGGDSHQSGSRGCTHSSVTVAGIAVLRLENSLAFRGQRIG